MDTNRIFSEANQVLTRELEETLRAFKTCLQSSVWNRVGDWGRRWWNSIGPEGTQGAAYRAAVDMLATRQQVAAFRAQHQHLCPSLWGGVDQALADHTLYMRAENIWPRLHKLMGEYNAIHDPRFAQQMHNNHIVVGETVKTKAHAVHKEQRMTETPPVRDTADQNSGATKIGFLSTMVKHLFDTPLLWTAVGLVRGGRAVRAAWWDVHAYRSLWRGTKKQRVFSQTDAWTVAHHAWAQSWRATAALLHKDTLNLARKVLNQEEDLAWAKSRFPASLQETNPTTQLTQMMTQAHANASCAVDGGHHMSWWGAGWSAIKISGIFLAGLLGLMFGLGGLSFLIGVAGGPVWLIKVLFDVGIVVGLGLWGFHMLGMASDNFSSHTKHKSTARLNAMQCVEMLAQHPHTPHEVLIVLPELTDTLAREDLHHTWMHDAAVVLRRILAHLNGVGSVAEQTAHKQQNVQTLLERRLAQYAPAADTPHDDEGSVVLHTLAASDGDVCSVAHHSSNHTAHFG